MTKPLDPIEPLMATMARDAAHPANCENCGAALQGPYCHDCGQHGHNPLRSFKHAVEDVFESFWHLDGRVFRTLADLLVPGRLIRNYLGGQRVRYIPPLRLYVILSLLTFFVAHFVAANVKGGFDINVDSNRYAKLTTVAQVEQQRDSALAEMDKDIAALQARKGDFAAAGALAGLQAGRKAIEKTAEKRIAQIEGRPPPPESTDAPSGLKVQVGPPVAAGDTSWFARMQKHWTHNAEENVRRFSQEKGAFAQSLLKHVPTVLFVLVPVFALVLRIAYLLKPMGYLEHLVVSLYSHAMLLLLALVLMLFVLMSNAGWLPASIMTAVWVLIIGAAMIYLLVTQKRVYGQSWPVTLIVWFIIGNIYFMLASLAMAAALTMSLLGGAAA